MYSNNCKRRCPRLGCAWNADIGVCVRGLQVSGPSNALSVVSSLSLHRAGLELKLSLREILLLNVHGGEKAY